jgi:hypothetical protein
MRDFFCLGESSLYRVLGSLEWCPHGKILCFETQAPFGTIALPGAR